MSRFSQNLQLQEPTLNQSRAIALLAQRLFDSKVLDEYPINDLDCERLWDTVVEQVPDVCQILLNVESELNYELNESQCSIAVNGCINARRGNINS